jgi:hypothetical protein
MSRLDIKKKNRRILFVSYGDIPVSLGGLTSNYPHQIQAVSIPLETPPDIARNIFIEALKILVLP